MHETRTYRGITLDIFSISSKRICYIILPEGLRSDLLNLEDLSDKYSSNIVLMTLSSWNSALSPWYADGVFKKEKPFTGHSDLFLRDLHDDYFPSIESSLGLVNPERFLVGISLSGLFAIWSCFKCNFIKGVASISGSLWFDNFSSWVRENPVYPYMKKIFISLGDREKNAKDPRMSSVEEATMDIVSSLRSRGAEVEFVMEKNTTHFSPILPRLELALDWLLEI